MRPVDAWSRVRANPDDAEAWAALLRLPLGTWHRGRLVARLEEDARSQAKINLRRRALTHTLPDLAHDGQVVNYVGESVVNASLTLLRAESAPPAGPQVPDAVVIDEPDLDPDTLRQLDDLYASAHRVRQPHSRHHLERGWAELRRLHTEPVTLDQVLSEAEGIDPADEDALDAAAARAYKRHERCRGALQLVLARRRTSLGEESYLKLRNAIGLLRRRRPKEGT